MRRRHQRYSRSGGGIPKATLPIGALIAAVLILGGIWKLYGDRAVAREFGGSIQEVKEDSIVLLGRYVREKAPGAEEADAELAAVEVRITPSTVIRRSGFRIPGAEELQATKGMFKPAELPQEVTEVSFDQLREDVESAPAGVVARSRRNVWGKAAFDASEIEYRTPLNYREIIEQ